MLGQKCKLHGFLAHAMAAYCIASIYYFAMSRGVGTPFSDSLTPEQQTIKVHSTKVRKQLFVQGGLFAIILLITLNPFERC